MQSFSAPENGHSISPVGSSVPARSVTLNFSGATRIALVHARSKKTQRDVLALVRLQRLKRGAQANIRNILACPWLHSDHAIAQRLAALRQLVQQLTEAIADAWRAWPIGRQAPIRLPTVCGCRPYFPAAP